MGKLTVVLKSEITYDVVREFDVIRVLRAGSVGFVRPEQRGAIVWCVYGVGATTLEGLSPWYCFDGRRRDKWFMEIQVA